MQKLANDKNDNFNYHTYVKMRMNYVKQKSGCFNLIRDTTITVTVFGSFGIHANEPMQS